jgi:UDP-N-acetylglucosamine--N-acetylmuramyl-(pentapeptide) pyrophosphoryl-undecaprenol N-acetylglucosamine transferase
MNARSLVFTGGHHNSALSVAQELKSQGWEIHWFGHRHTSVGDTSDSAEFQEVTASGIKFYNLLAGKIYKTFHPFKLIRLPLGFIQAFVWLLCIRPRGIVSFGGYLAVPTVISGFVLGIPSVTHEQTTRAGWANRFISTFVKRVYLSFPDTQNIFPKHKSRVIGLPLRPEILKLAKDAPSTRSTILISCGKQGSHLINQIVFDSLPALLANYEVIHQTGSNSMNNDYETATTLRTNLPADHRYRYTIYKYLDSVAQAAALSKSWLVIGRSGAHIIYELGFLGKLSVLIPLPARSHDEQAHNAAFLASHNLAVVLPQSVLTSYSLLKSIERAKSLTALPLSLPSDATQRMVSEISTLFS